MQISSCLLNCLHPPFSVRSGYPLISMRHPWSSVRCQWNLLSLSMAIWSSIMKISSLSKKCRLTSSITPLHPNAGLSEILTQGISGLLTDSAGSSCLKVAIPLTTPLSEPPEMLIPDFFTERAYSSGAIDGSVESRTYPEASSVTEVSAYGERASARYSACSTSPSSSADMTRLSGSWQVPACHDTCKGCGISTGSSSADGPPQAHNASAAIIAAPAFSFINLFIGHSCLCNPGPIQDLSHPRNLPSSC